jgi:hypothetical protein
LDEEVKVLAEFDSLEVGDDGKVKELFELLSSRLKPCFIKRSMDIMKTGIRRKNAGVRAGDTEPNTGVRSDMTERNRTS